MTEPLRTILYRRTNDPLDNGGAVSLERQRIDCERLIAEHNLTVVEVYEDTAASRRQRGLRVGFQRLLSDARAGRIDAVVAASLARLARTPADVAALMDSGIAIVTPQVDTTDTNGKIVATVIADLGRD
jgi:DNA invertase Pin-like site-specific DNA recombinase